VYNVVGAVRVRGPLDVQALRAALNAIVGRHEALRTTFSSIEGEPVQVIAATGELELTIEQLPAESTDERLRTLAREPFDLQTGPLVRAHLLQADAREQVLVLAMHHVISDGWSLGVLLRELSTLYQAFTTGQRSPLPDLEIQYADYAQWQRDRYDHGELDHQLDYWRTQLADAPPALELPTDHPRTALEHAPGAHHPIHIDRDQLDALRALSRKHGATLFMTLLAALQTLLARLSGQHDILIGTPIAGRTRPELENLIGFFVNTLVIRADLSQHPTFTDLLTHTRETSLDAYANQDIPFEKLVETLTPQRDLTRTPFFNVMLVLQNAPTTPLQLPNTTIHQIPITTNTAKFDLTLTLQEHPTGLHGTLEHNTHLYTPTTAHHITTAYQTILNHITTNPHQPTTTIPLLTPQQRHHLLTHTNTTTTPPPPNHPIHTLYEHQTTTTPNTTALITNQQHTTYQELNSAANRLARHLRSRGAGQEATVAILLEPSAEMLTAVLGVLKAGAGFLPIDPATPPARTAQLLEDAGAVAVLTTSEHVAQLPRAGVEALALDELDDVLQSYEDTNLELAIAPSSRAYTIYTSGSTGRPKGVAVEHRQILSYLSAITARLGIEPGWSYAMVQPLAVDACMTVLVPAICTGGTLHVLRRTSATDPDAVMAHFSRHDVDMLKIAPSHLAALLDARPSGRLLPRRVLVLGGEATPRALVASIEPLADPRCRIVVHYGPTETTVGVLTHAVQRRSRRRSGFAPIGRPLPHARVYVLDAAMEPVPIGVVGEIWIGGASVARGYVGRPGLTAERFLPDPFADRPGLRLYGSGDLGRLLVSGEIEFVGRTDRQLKVRGYRVEPGEVETALEQHPAVRRAVAVARRDATAGTQLVAYVVPERDEVERTDGKGLDALPARVREHARRLLPGHMVPSAVCVVDALPLNAHGKLDVRRLPDPSGAAVARADRRPPRTLLEARLVAIWEEVLEVGPIGVDDDFFELGGHSLLAVRILALTRKRIGRSAPLAALFRRPTVAGLARLLRDRAPNAREGTIVALKAGDAAPLFCVHPIGGDVLCYAELARALRPGRPLFGIRAVADAGAVASIEAMAARYVEEVRRTAGSGPYLLAGWSMGGLVAFEMARALVAGGHKLGMLALLDAHLPPRPRPREDEIPALARFAADLARVAGRDLTGLQDELLKRDRAGQLALVWEVLEREGLVSDDTTRDELLRRLTLFERNAAAAAAFTVRDLATRMLLLAAAGAGEPASLARAWERASGADVTLHVVPGDHYGMLAREHVRTVADVLEQHMSGVAGRLDDGTVAGAA